MCVYYIGTDATHADHIETIKSRNYVGVKPDGRFVPGQLGMGLVDGKLHHTFSLISQSSLTLSVFLTILVVVSLT